MIDAGHNTSKGWYPSVYFRGQFIDRLIISNFDGDHVSDLINLQNSCEVNAIFWNGSINSRSLALMKANGGMGNGIGYVHAWLQDVEHNSNMFDAPIFEGDVMVKHFANPYGVFNDTNNLSLVTFVSYGNFTILFPGDLETAGWRSLLKNDAFKKELAKVNVMVASHHGRENGCCEEIFDYCKPKLVIISDKAKQHETQETVDWYASKASGCVTINRRKRNVITTRKDGSVCIMVDQPFCPAPQWRIALEKNNPN